MAGVYGETDSLENLVKHARRGRHYMTPDDAQLLGYYIEQLERVARTHANVTPFALEYLRSIAVAAYEADHPKTGGPKKREVQRA